MKYTHLGGSGLVVSRIALGCMNYGSKRWRPWMVEEDKARDNFAYAIEHGINFFDTSNIYSMGGASLPRRSRSRGCCRLRA